MSRLGKLIVIISGLWFILWTTYAAHRNSDILQLAGMLATLCFLAAIFVSIVGAFVWWRKRRWRSLLPLTTCIVLIVLSNVLVHIIRHEIFVHSLPSYEAIIQQMQSGKILVSTNYDQIPSAVAQASLAYAVFAQKTTNGDLTVAFATEVGFPVLHSGYLYSSTGVITPGSEADQTWPIKAEEKPHWFFVSN